MNEYHGNNIHNHSECVCIYNPDNYGSTPDNWNCHQALGLTIVEITKRQPHATRTSSL